MLRLLVELQKQLGLVVVLELQLVELQVVELQVVELQVVELLRQA